MGHGLFRRVDSVGDACPVITHRASRAAGDPRLTAALARHGVIDAIPARINLVFRLGQRHPRTQAPANWPACFVPDTFDLGRDDLRLTEKISIGPYNSKRCVIDPFQRGHLAVPRRRLRRRARRGCQPATLRAMGRALPKCE